MKEDTELLSVIFLVDERVFHQSVIFQLAVFCAVGHVTIQEEALVESGSRGSTYTEAGTLDGITTDIGVHRTKLKLAQIFLLIGLHIARCQDRHDFLCDTLPYMSIRNRNVSLCGSCYLHR